jgi:membrane associated rhomboid family serine protease
MIPYADTIKINRPPWVNITLIVLNVGVFAYLLFLAPNPEWLVKKFAFIPYRFFHADWSFSIHHLMKYINLTIPLVTAQFIHADYMHIIGNMLFLYVFGDNIEDRIGHFRYFIFYLICGMIAMLVHGYVFKGSTLAVIGASGAIAGVLGGFYILYPSAKVKTFLLITTKEFPAITYLGVWFIFNLARGILYIEGIYREPVAWWAHIGGFIAGALLINIFAINPPKSK